jgi:ribosomal protein S18 acetylase RimI-like enzyme
MAPDIREATTADLPDIRDLLEEYAAWVAIDLSFQGFAGEVADLPGEYAPPGGTLLISRVGGEAAGMVALRRLDQTRAEMKRLYVRPFARGTSHGQHLVERAIAVARALGYRAIALDTLPVMQSAQRLYSKLGFRDVAPYYDSPVAGTRFMELTLDAARSPDARDQAPV